MGSGRRVITAHPGSVDLTAQSHERPILFRGAMVRAILVGRKRQTRRVMRPQPPVDTAEMRRGVTGLFVGFGRNGRETCVERYCPYGVVGDRLWVRETWLHDCPHCDDRRCGNADHVYYRATENDPSIFPKWEPSIHMPRWASRIRLTITSVRAQRLQWSGGADALWEGVEPLFGETSGGAFVRLWDSINAKRGFGWLTNPWVWVIGFRRLEP